MTNDKGDKTKDKRSMTENRDLLVFLVGIGLLILYLIFSAMTEMGTKWPGKKDED